MKENSKVRANNDFVKRRQDNLKDKMASRPEQRKEASKFDAYMCNDGEKAKEMAKKLTKGLDKDAFPVS